MADENYETRYEWLRPGQLAERQRRCSLVILPVAPLEYHGPHLPLGTDAINATRVAHGCCRKTAKGVVMPTLYAGTERERDPACLKALGFEPSDYVVGMDFPTRLWNSHYFPEEVFGVILSAHVRVLVEQGYKYILIANGHGAFNQIEVIRRLSIEYSNTTSSRVGFCVTFALDSLADGVAGHASDIETSLMMYYDNQCVDLGTLPPKGVPLKYRDFSVVDGIGFTPEHDPDHIVRVEDPRSADSEKGRKWFEAAVQEMEKTMEHLIGQQ